MELPTSKAKIKCPECNKYVLGTKRADGSISCQCPNCKVVFYSKEHKGREKFIKIKYTTV